MPQKAFSPQSLTRSAATNPHFIKHQNKRHNNINPNTTNKFTENQNKNQNKKEQRKFLNLPAKKIRSNLSNNFQLKKNLNISPTTTTTTPIYYRSYPNLSYP